MTRNVTKSKGFAARWRVNDAIQPSPATIGQAAVLPFLFSCVVFKAHFWIIGHFG